MGIACFDDGMKMDLGGVESLMRCAYFGCMIVHRSVSW